jgi:hypothetical protein
MEEKTISHLNTKWYYRFAKVAFILVSLFVVIIVLAIAFDSSEPYQVFDNNKSYIVCNTQEQQGVKYYISNSGENLSSTDLYSWDIDKLNTLCGEKISTLNYINNRQKYFDLFPVYRNVGSWFGTIFECLMSLAITLLIIGIIKRLFYYIILGKFFPKK